MALTAAHPQGGRGKHPSAVNLDHVQTVEKSRLVGFIGHAGEATMRKVCRALAVAVGCDA